jgi:hypothetical protein
VTLDDKSLDEALVSLVSRHRDGLEIDRVRATLPQPYRASKKRIEERLKRLERDGRIHRFKRVVLPEPFASRARARLLEVLRSPKTGKQIEAALPKTLKPRGWRKVVIEPALAERILFEHPDPKGKKSVRYAQEPAEPRQYLSAIERVLGATVKRLARSGVDRDALLAALSDTAIRAPRRDPHALLDAVLEIRPDARSHVLVSVRDLRRHLGWPKQDFDRAVLALARDGRITLHHHDHPTGLSPSEREDLVKDDRGNFYVGLVLEEAA